MSLQAILEQIRAAGDVQVKAVRARSEKDVQVILDEARAEADRLYQDELRQALQPESGERAAILNQARFQALCLTGKAREALADAALAAMIQHLKEIRYSQVYPSVLERILLEMLPGQDGARRIEDQLILEADPRDQGLLENILREKRLNLHMDYCLTCWGGLCGRSSDGSIHLVNTLESRLDRVRPILKQRLIAWFTLEATNPKETLPVREKKLA